MPVWLLGLGKAAGSALLGLAASLVTEAFLKKVIIMALEKLVKKTESDLDDKFLQEAKKVWEAE